MSKSSKRKIARSIRGAVPCVAELLEGRRLLSGDPSTWAGVTCCPMASCSCPTRSPPRTA